MTDNTIGVSNLLELEKLLKGEDIKSDIKSSAIFYISNLEKEFIIIDSNKLRPYRKAPQITFSLILNDIKLLEAICGRYIPIVDKDTKKSYFTEDEYNNIRKKMSGISEYNTGNFIFSDNLYFDGLDYYLERIDQNIANVNFYRKPIYDEITKIINDIGLSLTIGNNFGGDVELVEAGSTARYTNIPSDNEKKWDFDFTIRFNPENTWQIKEALEKGLIAGGHITRTSKYKVRLTDVEIPGLSDKVDIDFSLTPQKDKYLSSEDAIREKLENILKQNPEKYRLVIANIMYAKDMLKQSGAYKPARGILDGDRQNGGLGGIGIENWILQNGGSLIDASNEFMQIAENREFIEFEQVYFLMDFGCNHVGISKDEWPYDNFVVSNMRYLGYNKMKETLSAFLNEQKKKGFEV